jgi:curved DNA-binding protein CbpA
MVNYYKILDLENYASVEQVKQAYKAKIKVLHPDVNPNKDAEEITQYLNLAKDQLGTPTAKDEYDKNLRLAYINEIYRLQNLQKNRTPFPSISIRERLAQMDEYRKLQIKDKYERGLTKFPFWMRVFGLITVSLWGLQIIYSNYFLYYGSLDRVRIILGFVLFSIAIMLAANEAYTRHVAKSIERPYRYNFETAIAWIFVFGFILGPASVAGLNTWRKSYHLTHHYDYAFARIHYAESNVDGAVLEYHIEGERYIHRVSKEIKEILVLPNSQTIIKYAKVNPLICEALSKNEANKVPREL